MNPLIYINAFLSCYPQKRVELRPAPRRIGGGWWVIINGERGDRPLSDSELESAVRDFNRGKVQTS